MQKYISVVNYQGEAMEPTYPKRAKQLVKSDKAKWLDNSTICLIKNEMECGTMEYNSNGPNPAYETERKEIVGAVPVYESRYTDEELYKMAKKRVNQRMGLIIHIFVYFTVNIFLFVLSVSAGQLWNFYVVGGWGIGIVCHMASYFFGSTPERIHDEYLRQKNKYRV